MSITRVNCMVGANWIRLSPSKGERMEVRGSTTSVGKITEPSPYPLPWEGRGEEHCAKELPRRFRDSR